MSVISICLILRGLKVICQVVLRAIMLRRKKTDILNGKALVDLPARTVQIVTCDFDEEERSFYTNLEEKITSAMEKVMQAGDMQKSYTHILVLLLRLRQGMAAIRSLEMATYVLFSLQPPVSYHRQSQGRQ